MVSPDSDRVSRVRPYSGYSPGALSFRIRGYHPVPLYFPVDFANSTLAFNCPYNPKGKPLVWAIPFSLAATKRISSISFPLLTKMSQFSRYRLIHLCIQCTMMRDESHRVSPFGHLRVTALFQLAGDFRRYTRPSSPIDAKASTSSP